MSRLALAILLITMAAASTPSSAQQPPNWATTLDSGSGETITNLQFYFHDILTGKNPTAVQVIKPLTTSSAASRSNSFFGAVTMADDPLTVAAEASSKVVGRAQGMYAFASQNDFTLLMAMSYGFTDGPYNGSSLSIMGGNPAMNVNRELPVLGGTGVFRMARGYALMKTVSLSSGGDAVVFYNVTVIAPASNVVVAGRGISPASGGGATPAGTKALSSDDSSTAVRRGERWMVGAVVGFAAVVVCFTM